MNKITVHINIIATLENQDNGTVKITETFDAENMNSLEMQRAGWQAILDNFKKLVEKK